MKKYSCPVCRFVLVFEGKQTTPCSDGINADARIVIYFCPKCSIKFELWDVTRFKEPKKEFWIGIDSNKQPVLIAED
jgi:hypothetical protein